jgi:hypothetical protein
MKQPPFVFTNPVHSSLRKQNSPGKFIWRVLLLLLLLIFRAFNDTFNSSDYITSNNTERVKNWKWCERKRSWPILRYYSGICLEGMRITRNTVLRAEIWTRGTSNYEVGVLTGYWQSHYITYTLIRLFVTFLHIWAIPKFKSPTVNGANAVSVASTS